MKLLILALSTLVIVSSEVIRRSDVTVKEIIKEVGPEFIDIIVKNATENVKLLERLDACEDPTEANIEFQLYNREHSHDPLRITSEDLDNIDPDKKVIVLIHGWLSGSFGYGFPQLISAYLERYDANVIMVDWSIYAWRAYPMSVCLLPKVANLVGNVVCKLSEKHEISMDSIHLVGHSLGGQMSGYIGQYTQATCDGTIGRITGLDPAGPLFQESEESERLDDSDAGFVDVIHTNQFELGYVGSCGTVDFYPNCGVFQPGCEDVNLADDLGDWKLVDLSCEHLRALDYMAESINSNKFQAASCEGCPLLCFPDALLTIHADMGEDCNSLTSGSYVVETNSASPYAKGSGESD